MPKGATKVGRTRFQQIATWEGLEPKRVITEKHSCKLNPKPILNRAIFSLLLGNQWLCEEEMRLGCEH